MKENQGKNLAAATGENNLKAKREQAGWTQVRLRINSGVGIGTISNIENGMPTELPTAEKLATALGFKVSELFPYLAPPKKNGKKVAA